MNFQHHNSTIWYSKEGAGQPIILIHGFGEDSTIWDEQVKFLRQHCLLIVPDLPGSGQSQMIQAGDDQSHVSIEDYAEVIHSLLSHERISSCIVLGHSMGGYITLAFAAKYASFLKGFGMVHSTAYADSDEKKQARIKGIEMMQHYGGFSFLKNTIPNLFACKYKEQHSKKVDALIDLGKVFSTEALVQYYVAMMNREDRTDVLKNCKVPVLFIAGEEDVAVSTGDVLQQVQIPELSIIHILKEVGHMGMWEQTEAMNKHLLQFINLVEEVQSSS